MVVDIGGGMMDIVVILMGDIVIFFFIKMVGDKFDMEILNYIKCEYKLLIGECIVEDIKVKVVMVFLDVCYEEIFICGWDMVFGFLRIIIVNSKEVEEVFCEFVVVIV